MNFLGIYNLLKSCFEARNLLPKGENVGNTVFRHMLFNVFEIPHWTPKTTPHPSLPISRYNFLKNNVFMRFLSFVAPFLAPKSGNTGGKNRKYCFSSNYPGVYNWPKFEKNLGPLVQILCDFTWNHPCILIFQKILFFNILI